MEKQQRNKLIVAIVFFIVITVIAIFAYVNIIVPNREKRKQSATHEKLNLKTGYKTKVNPNIIDSIMRAKNKK